MRNFTLGLSIVVIGILAALPFRRTDPIDLREIESAPTQPVSTTSPSFPSSEGMLVDQFEPQEELLARVKPETRPTTAPWPAHRELSEPLTYEQLAMPISRPEQIEQRFSATEKVKIPVEPKQQMAKVRKGIASQPKTASHSLVSSNPPREPVSVLDGPPSQKTSLASVPLSEMQTETLPKKRTSTRERHWIRQP